MTFNKPQVQEILNIIEFHHLFVISTNFGTQMLSEEDKSLLTLFGVDIDVLSKAMPVYDQMYIFGILSAILKENDVKSLDFSDFKEYINRGQYRPLSNGEQFQLDISKRQTYTHLKGLKDRAKTFVESTIIEEERISRSKYEEAIKQGISQGVQDRKSVSSIVSDIGHQLKEWQHDWGRIVETECNNILQLGRAQEIEAKRGKDALVYKTTFPMVCRHCLKLYTTNGVGSKPRLFKLSDLLRNGTNVGKKVVDWLPVVGSTHPYCRCCLYDLLPGHEWNEETKKFELLKNWVRKVERLSKVRITVGDKTFEV
jgi:hypothetical protein